jgi:hypothetical protein
MNTCDYDHQTDEEIRQLPISRGKGHSNVLVCHTHYLAEMKYRREMVEDGWWTKDVTDFPAWESLKVYGG